jgi:hypothetical protein
MEPHRLNITTEILSVEEARKRLPRVKAALERLMQTTREIRALQRESEGVQEEERKEVLREVMAAREEKWREELAQLNGLGAYLKDPDTGLIDFYTWMDGEIAFLCWRHGEEKLEWWHGLEEGFRGRKRLPD